MTKEAVKKPSNHDLCLKRLGFAFVGQSLAQQTFILTRILPCGIFVRKLASKLAALLISSNQEEGG